jgi:hypothetical protein
MDKTVEEKLTALHGKPVVIYLNGPNNLCIVTDSTFYVEDGLHGLWEYATRDTNGGVEATFDRGDVKEVYGDIIELKVKDPKKAFEALERAIDWLDNPDPFPLPGTVEDIIDECKKALEETPDDANNPQPGRKADSISCRQEPREH